MRLRFPAVLLLALAAPAGAADRTFAITSFERVRIEGPFEVRIAPGAPAARAQGDKALLDRVRLDLNGATLVVRLGAGGWGETPQAARNRSGGAARGGPVVIQLTTPRIAGAAVLAGAKVQIVRAVAPRVDLSITGPGTLEVAAVEADQLVATVVGSGTLAAGGRTQKARLMVNGPGAITGALSSNELIARVEGTGAIETRARYTAAVSTAGIGRVTVHGTPKCTVTGSSGGPVRCGD